MVDFFFRRYIPFRAGTFLAVQWLRFQASTAGDMGSVPGWRIET